MHLLNSDPTPTMSSHETRPPILYRAELLAVRRAPDRFEEILAPALDRVRQWLNVQFGADAADIAVWFDGPPDSKGHISLGVHWWDSVSLRALRTAFRTSFRAGPVSLYMARFWSDAYRKEWADAFCHWTGLPSLLHPPEHPHAGAVSPIWGNVPLGSRNRPAYRWWYSVMDGLPLTACPRVRPRALANAVKRSATVPMEIERLTSNQIAQLMCSPATRPRRA